MDLTQVAVTAGGAGLIVFTLWFFFGKMSVKGRNAKPQRREDAKKNRTKREKQADG
jgi:hypothetical protein